MRPMCLLHSLFPVLVLSFSAFGCGDSGGSKGPDGGTSGGDGGGGSNHGWKAAVGDDGTLLQTFDDQHWEAVSLTAPRRVHADLYGVTCVGNLLGWVSGENGLVAHTQDGGLHWLEQNTGTQANLRALHFGFTYEAPVGVAVGDRGTLIVSSNYGSTWKAIEAVDVTLRGVEMSYGQELIVVVGDGGTLLHSSDDGNTFETLNVPDAGAFTGVSVDDSGALVLAVDDLGQIWRSDDQARSFVLDHTAEGALSSVAVAHDGSWAIAAGSAGVLHWTFGEAWQAGQLVESLGLVSAGSDIRAALISRNSSLAYVAGAHGALYQSANTGATFERVQSNTTVGLNGLEDLDW
jgi:photosystem II stability/assembly factor-like uncharacterized protein